MSSNSALENPQSALEDPAIGHPHSALPIFPFQDDNVIALSENLDRSLTPNWGLPREGSFWLIVCVLMLMTGLLKGINLLILLSYLLLGIWVSNWYMALLDIRRVAGRRITSGPIFAGGVADFEVEITVNSGGGMRGLIVESLGDDRRTWMILRLDRGQSVHIRWQCVYSKRGRRSVGVLQGISRFPFGLFSRSKELAPASERIVLPRIGAVNSELLKRWLGRTARGDGRLRRRLLQRTLLGAEIHGLRDYRPGDSIRWIHWRSSARRGQLLVCEFEENPSTDLILVVEPWLPERPSNADHARLEALISMAGTICCEWCRDLSTRLTLIIANPVLVCLPFSTGPEFALRALEALAVEEGHPGVPSDGWLDKLPHSSQSTPILTLSSRPNSALAGDVAAFVGRPIASLHSDENPPWYAAPGPMPPIRSP